MQPIALHGVSDEIEVASVTVQGVNLKLVGIVEDDERFTPRMIFDYELEPVHRINELEPDCILITCLEESGKKNGKTSNALWRKKGIHQGPLSGLR